MVMHFWGRCPSRIPSPFTLLLLLAVSHSVQADLFWPSNVSTSFTTLEEAETAMRAVNASTALLQFDRLSVSGIWTYRYYAVPPVPTSPPFWADCGNVPGFYGSGQAVCDARRTWINWANPLTYTPNPNLPQDGYGMLGQCLDRTNILGSPGRWVSCPSGYTLANTTVLGTPCGGNSCTWVVWGPTVTCKNYTTAIIYVQAKCPIDDLTADSGEAGPRFRLMPGHRSDPCRAGGHETGNALSMSC